MSIEPPTVLFQSGQISIEAIPDWWLLAELLHALFAFYRTDSNRFDALPLFEMELACLASLFSPLPTEQPLFSAKDLVTEVRQREWLLRELTDGPLDLG